MTKHALDSVQHFDAGGTALGGPVTAGSGNAVNPSSQGIAGAVGSVLGTNNNFQASGAQITPGTNVNQLNAAYTGTQGALTGANNLATTLTPGVAQGAGSQNTLTNELTAETMGGGPNPAQAALNQNTGTNVANQAALAAGQRGASGNVGLIAREAGQQGAAIQQNAVGQEATQEAQQQLNAQNALANVANSQVGQGTNAVQLQNQTQQNEQNILQGANTATNNAAVSQQENINSTNAAVAAGNQNSNQNVAQGVGNALNALGGGAGTLFAEGGKVLPKHLHAMASIYHPHMMADGGMVWQNSVPVSSSINPGASPNLPQDTFQSGNSPSAPSGGGGSGSMGFGTSTPTMMAGEPGVMGGAGAGGAAGLGEVADLAVLAARGGRIPNMGRKLEAGGKVPGKPKVNKDAYKNDTVNAKLSPGEVVIDINTLKDKGKLGQMARFVAQNIERKKMGRKM